MSLPRRRVEFGNGMMVHSKNNLSYDYISYIEDPQSNCISPLNTTVDTKKGPI